MTRDRDSFFKAGVDSLADGESFDVDPADAYTGAIEVHNIAHGAGCDVELLADPDNDGNFQGQVMLDSLSGNGISQSNQIEASDDGNMLLRITNTSGGAADYIVTGREIPQ